MVVYDGGMQWRKTQLVLNVDESDFADGAVFDHVQDPGKLTAP